MKSSTSRALVATLALCSMMVRAEGQNVLFEDDFESGISAWTVTASSGTPFWHAASVGECGAPSGVAMVGNPQCVGPYGNQQHYLRSPVFSMGGPGPWSIDLDAYIAQGAGGVNLSVKVIDAQHPIVQSPAFTIGAVQQYLPFHIDLPQVGDGGWSGRDVFLEFLYTHGSSFSGPLVLVDNVVVRDTCLSPTSYCAGLPNSAGFGASLAVSGSTYVSDNAFSLAAWGLPPNQPAIAFYGDAQVQYPWGDGVRCVGGIIFRIEPPAYSSAQGQLSIQLDLAAPPMNSGFGVVESGRTWNFQLWYRDAAAGGSGFNTSNGVEVTFCN